MNTSKITRILRLGAVATLVALLTAAASLAQSAAPSNPTPSKSAASSPAQPPKSDDTIQLNAFEVTANTDSGYGALESNSITRFRTELFKLPVTADVYTETFMRDIAATSVEDMVIQYGGG